MPERISCRSPADSVNHKKGPLVRPLVPLYVPGGSMPDFGMLNDYLFPSVPIACPAIITLLARAIRRAGIVRPDVIEYTMEPRRRRIYEVIQRRIRVYQDHVIRAPIACPYDIPALGPECERSRRVMPGDCV